MSEAAAPFYRDEHRSESGQSFIAGEREYVLAGKIGNGAIGMVRKARDSQTGETVAIKFLAPEAKYIEQSSWPDIRDRFRREGQRGSGLNHENLVKILAYEDNIDGSCFVGPDGPMNPFIVMEYIHGNTLESFIKGQFKKIGERSPNISRQTVHIALAVADALVYLHKRGIVHRDIKPANIFLSQAAKRGDLGQVKLGDFGVVKWNDYLANIGSGTLTVTGQLGLGTMKYMSPEQYISPKDAGLPSDMYSFGATLMELCSTTIVPNQYYFTIVTMLLRERGDKVSRLADQGFADFPLEHHDFVSFLVSSFALGPTSRPTSTRFSGRLSYLLTSLTEPE